MNQLVYRILRFFYRKYVAPVKHYSAIETVEQFAARGVIIGKNSGIGKDYRIDGPTTIGENVMMASGVTIMTRNHEHARTDIPMNQQGPGRIEPVVIGDDVWLCEGATILPGVHVGSHAIVGAKAVVGGDVPEWAIVAGNPARLIKYRKIQHEASKP
jgi:maltose O-acetyltransferase